MRASIHRVSAVTREEEVLCATPFGPDDQAFMEHYPSLTEGNGTMRDTWTR